MSSAGVFHKPGDWKSTHTFRRTLGTRMLEAEVPLTTIMQVLGQRDPQSSKAYLSMSEKKLSECSLDLKGIEIAAGGWQ
jgi:integrase